MDHIQVRSAQIRRHGSPSSPSDLLLDTRPQARQRPTSEFFTSTSFNNAQPSTGRVRPSVLRSASTVHIPSRKVENDRSAGIDGDVEKVVQVTYADEAIETPYDWIRRYIADVTSQKISHKIKRIAQNHRSSDYHKQFLPRSEIEKVVGKPAVLLELSRHKDPIRVVKPDNYQKILAVLHLLKMPEVIRAFIVASVSDVHLPFGETTIVAEDGRRVKGLRSRRFPDIYCTPFARQDDVQVFLEQQWSVISHVFEASDGNHVPSYRLDPEIILPYCEYRLTGRKGAYGNIYRTRIHPDHHPWDWSKKKNNKDKKTRNVFAVKVLKESDPTAFAQEVKVLEKLNKSTHAHEHLIELLAAYELAGIYHLVFPWADCDLFGYWERHPCPDRNADRADWLAKQCHGLAEALNRIHHYQTHSGSLIESISKSEKGCTPTSPLSKANQDPLERRLFGRHGDLKPENIIWLPDSGSIGNLGILKIADFGTTQFSTEQSKRGIIPNSPTYHSPEYELNKTYSILCDIWALGCIYLELAIWYHGGLKAVRVFAKNRLDTDLNMAEISSDTFFVIHTRSGAPKAEVKPAILKKIEDLYSLQSFERRIPTKDFFQTLLNLIRCDMLVINYSVDDVSSDYRSQQIEHEEHMIKSLEGALSDTLPIPDQSSTRRKSSGTIFRALGIHCKVEEGLSRRSTADQPTPQPVARPRPNLSLTRLRKSSIIRSRPLMLAC
ncbi:kinase-like protein [Pyrenochaeta sp. DS3sAY3a]|nr:kinase-like protein [Pyrenochaeta sp. DS3sAY3a]